MVILTRSAHAGSSKNRGVPILLNNSSYSTRIGESTMHGQLQSPFSLCIILLTDHG